MLTPSPADAKGPDLLDLRNVPNDYFGKVAAVGAIVVYNATDEFEAEVDKALAQQSANKGTLDPSPDAAAPGHTAAPQPTPAAAKAEANGGGPDKGGEDMAQNVVLMALSQRVGFVSSMAASVINKAAEGKSNVAKAG